jgi:hypothetical protein
MADELPQGGQQPAQAQHTPSALDEPLSAPVIPAPLPQQSTPPPAQDAQHPSLLSNLRQPLSRVQSIVGIGAGLLTILGTLGSMMGVSMYKAMPVQGEVVATVRTVRFRTPVRDATVEILTPAAAVVTTLSAGDDGRIQYQLREGQYRLRVTHPRYIPDVKDIQVWGGQRADIRVALAPRPLPAPKPAPSPKEESGFKKFFGKLGF